MGDPCEQIEHKQQFYEDIHIHLTYVLRLCFCKVYLVIVGNNSSAQFFLGMVENAFK